MLNANTYVTSQEGIGGTIRNKYEDFHVEEIPDVLPNGEGPNVWIWIEKLGRTTLDVVLDIARDLHISRKRMGFAGMKDKKAFTRQWICIVNMESEEQLKEVQNLNIYKTDFLKVVRGRKKLRMGQLKGGCVDERRVRDDRRTHRRPGIRLRRAAGLNQIGRASCRERV